MHEKNWLKENELEAKLLTAVVVQRLGSAILLTTQSDNLSNE